VHKVISYDQDVETYVDR